MRNFGYVFIGLAFIMVAFGSSCSRKPIVKRTIDTTYNAKKDSAGVIHKDTAAEKKVEKEIETIYVEVAADCPNVPKETITKWKERTQKACSMESISGGKSYIYFPNSKDSIEVTWNKNKGTAVEKGRDTVIKDKTEITYPREKEKKMGLLQLAYKYPKEGLLLFFIGLICGVIGLAAVRR